MENKSDTPETDGAVFAPGSPDRWNYEELVDANFARKLEREKDLWRTIADAHVAEICRLKGYECG